MSPTPQLPCHAPDRAAAGGGGRAPRGRQRGALQEGARPGAPRRGRVTDLLLPAANQRRSRGRRDFIHSFIKKRRWERRPSGPPRHSRQSASSLLSEQSSSSSHFQMAGMQRSFRHWNWSSSHSLTPPARHGAAPGSAGRAPPPGASRGRSDTGQGPGDRRGSEPGPGSPGLSGSGRAAGARRSRFVRGWKGPFPSSPASI